MEKCSSCGKEFQNDTDGRKYKRCPKCRKYFSDAQRKHLKKMRSEDARKAELLDQKRKEWFAEHYQKNKNERREKSREYYLKNREEICAKRRARYEKEKLNPNDPEDVAKKKLEKKERFAAYLKEYWRRNKDAIMARRREARERRKANEGK